MRAAVALCTCLALLSCSRAKPTPKPISSASESFGPRAELVLPFPVLSGPELLEKIRSSGGKGVVVNVWASWCDPCRDELPLFEKVAPHLEKLGVPIWLVNVDEADALPAAHTMLQSLHIERPTFAAAPPLSDFKPALDPNWRGAIPVSFLFDTTGKLRYAWPGEVFENELVPIVEGFAAGKHIDGTANFGQKP